MTGARLHIYRLAAALATAVLLLLTGGCDRLGDRLGLTGQVAALAPRPVGPERLRVRLAAKGAQATLAPVARDGAVTVWQTLDGITLSFRHGVLVATRGLGADLMSADVDTTLAMLRGATYGATEGGYYPHIRTYLDGENRTVFTSYQCRRATADATARRIEERCVSPGGAFTNIYWLDGAGAVIKSRQWVGPVIEYMETERVMR